MASLVSIGFMRVSGIMINPTPVFYDSEIGTADNKNALKPPFFAILSPKNGMGGFVIDI